VKKTVKQKPLTKGELEWLKLNRVPLDEVEVLAAKAVKMIKAKRTLSADKKAEKLARVAATLERARGRGGLSKGGAWDLEHPFGLGLIVHDWEAVLKGFRSSAAIVSFRNT